MSDDSYTFYNIIYWTGIIMFNAAVWGKELLQIPNFLMSIDYIQAASTAVQTVNNLGQAAVNLPLREKVILLSIPLILIGGAGVYHDMITNSEEED